MYPPIHPEIDTPSLLSPSIVECKKLTDQNNCSKKKEPKPPQICTHLQSFEGATCCLEIKLMFLPQEMITPDPAQPHNRVSASAAFLENQESKVEISG